MSGDQVPIWTAIFTLIGKMGTWPAFSFLFVIVFGPEVVLFAITWDERRNLKAIIKEQKEMIINQDKRFESVVNMYENNVALVKSYQTIADGYQDLIIFNSTIMTQVKDVADNNLFCPLNRKSVKQREIEG